MACFACGRTPADFLSPQGLPLCRLCFHAGEVHRQHVRGVESEFGLQTTGDARNLGSRLIGIGIACIVLGTPFVIFIGGWVRALCILVIVGGATAIGEGIRRNRMYGP